jgi:hypothetical protein
MEFACCLHQPGVVEGEETVGVAAEQCGPGGDLERAYLLFAPELREFVPEGERIDLGDSPLKGRLFSACGVVGDESRQQFLRVDEEIPSLLAAPSREHHQLIADQGLDLDHVVAFVFSFGDVVACWRTEDLLVVPHFLPGLLAEEMGTCQLLLQARPGLGLSQQ